MTATPNGTEGQRRKRRAHKLLEQHRKWVIRRARRVLLMLLIDRGQATMDDVRGLVPLPDGINPKCFGPVPVALADAELIRSAGMVPSRRPEAHGRKLELWELNDRAGAIDWLRANPELPEPASVDNGQQRDLFDI